MGLLDSIGDFIGSGLSAITAPFEAIGDVIGNGVKGLFGQSDMDKYERQLSRNMSYQKDMIDYTNDSNLAFNKELTRFNNAESKAMTEYFYNKYQSPQARMQQFKDAGISPFLAINGSSGLSPVNSSATSGGASPASSGASYQASRYQLSSLISTLKDEKRAKKAQADYQESLVEEKKLSNLEKMYDLYAPTDDDTLEYELIDGKYVPSFSHSRWKNGQERLIAGLEKSNSMKWKKRREQLTYDLSNFMRQIKQNDFDNDQLEQLRKHNLFPALEAAFNVKYGKDITKRELDALNEEIERLKNDNKLNEIENLIFLSDWNLPDWASGFEMPMKSLLWMLKSAISQYGPIFLRKGK